MKSKLLSTVYLVAVVLIASSIADGGLSRADAENECPSSVVQKRPEVPGMPNAPVTQIGSKCDNPGGTCTDATNTPGKCKQILLTGTFSKECEAGQESCWCSCVATPKPVKPPPPKPAPPKPPKPVPPKPPVPDGGPSDLALGVFAGLIAAWLGFAMWRRRRADAPR